MKYLKPINEIWGPVLKRDLLGETREEDKFRSRDELRKYLNSEIEKQGENVVIQNLDVSLIEDLGGLFETIANDVKTLDLSGWKTSGVNDMCMIFYFCKKLESINVSGWDTSNVTDMSYAFYGCENLKSLDMSGWDTSNVKDMQVIFYSCDNLTSLDLSSWDTSNVWNMRGVFYGCIQLESLDLSGWDTSKVKNMNHIL